MIHPTYTYDATVVSVTDGDTVKVDVHLGFDVSQRVALRLNKVHAAERSEPNGAEHTMNLRGLIPVGTKVTLVSTKLRGIERDKYGRYVADIWIDDVHINSVQQALIGFPQGKGLQMIEPQPQP